MHVHFLFTKNYYYKKIFTILSLMVAVFALNAQQARIVLEAGDVWGDGTGYQILIDADANTTENILGNLECGQSYADWEYTLPLDAAANDQAVCVNAYMDILIPAGTYDYVVTNPGCAGYGVVYIASDQCDPSRGDNVTFEANKTYHFVPSLNGDYDCVTITVIDGLTSIEENSSAFSVYPNPATDVLNIEGQNINNVEIINLVGQVVATTNTTSVNVANLANGAYFVRVNFNNGEVAAQKFIKK